MNTAIEQLIAPDDIYIEGRDFTPHELQAMCLDNLLTHYIGNVYITTGYLDTPNTRIQAAAAGLPEYVIPRCIFGWTTALWIYGLTATPYHLDIISVSGEHRLSKYFRFNRVRIHEMQITGKDIWYISNLKITSPECTTFDIALYSYTEKQSNNFFSLKVLLILI
ncbi:MAG: hypothetical protein QM571_01730 [Micrococcaceae bacterium]